ncbi:MAG: restriction endonuclease [Candidatus Aenigmarchaeota archaeon]|nr:restriction endonuclease [Candidatus Aenigmarchaeota archaeon]
MSPFQIFIYLFILALFSAFRAYLQKDIFDLSPKKFERLCSQILEKDGYKTEWKMGSFTGKHQIDITAERGLLFNRLFKRKYFVECKRWSRPVGIKEIRNFYAKIEDESKWLKKKYGLFITSSSFTRPAKNYAKKKGIILIDGVKLRQLAIKHGFAQSRGWVFLKTIIVLFLATYLPYVIIRMIR